MFLSALVVSEALPAPVAEPAGVYGEGVAADVAALLWAARNATACAQIKETCS